MSFPTDFAEITETDAPIGSRTWLKLGGPAQYLVSPRSEEELVAVVQAAHAEELSARVLGGGSNVLVRDEGVGGIVLLLEADCFKEVAIDGTTAKAGGGASLAELITKTVQAGLGGLDALVGIPGTVGGALHGNAGGKNADVGQFVSSVDVLTAKGERFTRQQSELSFAYRQSSVNELVVLSAAFSLKEEDPDEITPRMRQTWIAKKAAQPFSHQSAGCIFKNPRGLSAGSLIERAGLKGTRIGGAEVSERHANFIITHPEATSDDVQRLIELTRSRVAEEFSIELELEIEVW